MHIADATFDLCRPTLDDEALEEEDKMEKLEQILRKETDLTGRPLEDAVLHVLWRYRDSKALRSSPPAAHKIARRSSPAPWQISRSSTPLASPPLSGNSAAPPHPFGAAPPAFTRTKSFVGSPFGSPRPSPSLAFASHIPHSPNLSSYEFSEPTSGAQANDYGDFGSDTVDWLVNDDATSRPSSSGAGSAYESSLNANAATWIQPQQTEMSPYDMLRSVLGDGKTDEEIEAALEANGYDLSTAVMSLMGSAPFEDQNNGAAEQGQILVGKSMMTSQPINIAQSTPPRSNVMCKYWLSTGTCLRADCRFSHNLSSHICKYWMMGNCLAGDACIFSHDPSLLLGNLNINGNQTGETPPQGLHPSFQVQDYDAFPTLQPAMLNNQWSQRSSSPNPNAHAYQYAGSQGVRAFAENGRELRPNSRGRPSNISIEAASPRSPRLFASGPSSRHSSRGGTPIPSVDDTDAFPTLGSASAKGIRKHHGKRGGHGHNHPAKENTPSSLADVVRMSPSPVPGLLRKGLVKTPGYANSKEHSAAANSIPAPEHIPWLESGEKVNAAYLKARQDAFKHGGLRNKFLQSAAQAWNRNDARAAKALSLRGQSENDLMRKSHREAARLLYESRNAHHNNNNASSPLTQELYVDLHGLHPEEAIEYFARVLQEQKASVRPVYAITGTGHHSKGGKDKVGKAVRGWLAEGGWVFREFSVPGDRGNVGGILGVDARTGGKETGKGGEEGEEEEERKKDESGMGKVRVMSAKEVPTGPRRR